MTPIRKDMKFVPLHARLLKFKVSQNAAFSGNVIVSGMSKKARRGVLVYLYLGKKSVPLNAINEVSRINKNSEVRTTGKLICRVHGLIRSGLMGNKRHQTEVSSGREAKNTHSVRVHPPLARVLTDQAEGPLGILHWGLVLGPVFSARDPILEKKARHPDRI
jgi:hypothetical protein